MSRRPRNIDDVQSARLQSRAIVAGIDLPPGYELLVTDSRCGRHRSSSKTCTVPLWATKRDFNGDASTDFELYYAAHEAAHAWVCVNKERDSGPHGPNFYKHFKRLCDPTLWHHELGYKTREAKRAGIVPSPEANRLRAVATRRADAIDALPDAPAAVRDTVNRMVSTPTQDDTAYDDYIKNNPKLQRALKARAIPDRDVKSFVRGWAKLDQRN